MNLSLRAKLRLPEGCSDKELQDACNRYYALYKGVMDSSTSEGVRAVASSKLEDLIDHARREGVELREMDGISFANGTVNINATVEQMLSGCKGALSPDKVTALEKAIGALPNSAKRYYLSALVVLSKGNGSLDSFEEAVQKLKSAASEDPQNIVYTAMLESLYTGIKEYRDRLSEYQAAETARIKKEQAWETFKEVMSVIGSILLWVGGAALAIAGGVLSCVCGMCESC